MAQDPTKIGIQFDPFQRHMVGTTRHGLHHFDIPFISHIHGNLYMGGCEAGLILPPEFKHIVSLYPWERYKILHEIDSELYIRAYDAGMEEMRPMLRDLVGWIKGRVEKGPTLVHCQAGLNRSGLVCAYFLTESGFSGEMAIDMLRKKRSPAVLCNPIFEAFIRKQG